MNLPFWNDYGPIDPDTADAFDTAPGAWDIMVLANLPGKYGPGRTIFPGIVEVRHKGRKIRLNHASGPGVSGRSEAQLGYEPGDITIECIMWTRSQWQKFQKLLPILQPGKLGPTGLGTSVSSNGALIGTLSSNLNPQPTQAPPDTSPDLPVVVEHPALQMLGVRSIVFDKVMPPVPWKGRPDMGMSLMLCHEWKKPKAGKTKALKGPTQGLKLAASFQAPLLTNVTDPTINPSQTSAGAP